MLEEESTWGSEEFLEEGIEEMRGQMDEDDAPKVNGSALGGGWEKAGGLVEGPGRLPSAPQLGRPIRSAIVASKPSVGIAADGAAVGDEE
jgi:hypothetical protein